VIGWDQQKRGGGQERGGNQARGRNQKKGGKSNEEVERDVVGNKKKKRQTKKKRRGWGNASFAIAAFV